MTTQTEAHLQVIARKTEEIKELRQNPAGTIPPAEIQEITEKLQEIGEVVSQLPKSFTVRYPSTPWDKMRQWAFLNTLASGPTEKQLTNMICVLDEAETEISRHADPSGELLQGIIKSLNSTYEQCSKEWYSHLTTPYLLVSLSAIMLIIRIALQDVGFVLTVGQMTVYGIHALIVFLIILEIQRPQRLDYILAPSIYNFSTLTEFYDSQSYIKMQEISEINIILGKRRQLRFWGIILWMATLTATIIVTSIQN